LRIWPESISGNQFLGKVPQQCVETREQWVRLLTFFRLRISVFVEAQALRLTLIEEFDAGLQPMEAL
jgi:hypothetical protein